MGAGITLVGTTHDDLDGPERLEKLLRSIKPDVISIETSFDIFTTLVAQHQIFMNYTAEESERKFTEKVPAEFQGKIDWEHFALQRRQWGYESWVPWVYMLRRGAKILWADHPALVTDQVVENTLGVVSTADDWSMYACSIAEQYERVRKTYAEVRNGKNSTESLKVASWIIQRNRYMAKELDSAAKYMKTGTIVHISGAAHIFGDHPNIYDLLPKKHDVRAVKLPEADSLPPLENRMTWLPFTN